MWLSVSKLEFTWKEFNEMVEKGWHDVEFDSDCLELIKQINHGGPVGWGILAAAWHLATRAEKTPLKSSRNEI